MQSDGEYHVMVFDRSTSTKRPVAGDDRWRRLGTPIAVDPTGERVIVKDREVGRSVCWIVTRATNAAMRVEDCEHARFLDGRTALVGKRLVDLDSGAMHPADNVYWFGGDLGLAERQHAREVDVVQRNPWRVLATVAPLGVIVDGQRVTIIGARAIVTVDPTGVTATRPLTVEAIRILDIRGDVALLEVARPLLTAAAIRLSTGQLLGRTPSPN
jgi:hypothetical protein